MTMFNIEGADGLTHEIDVPSGRSLLDACRKGGLPMEGLCGGELACSTCHVVVAPQWIERLPRASAEEEDMLDLLPNTVAGSRLACQIRASDATDGLCVRLMPMVEGAA